jgi:uncharacterized membrane protein YdjX (TVP38/TMEM64 family)
MSDRNAAGRLTLRRAAPLMLVAAAAVLGALLLRDVLSFEGLREHRGALTAWRDRNYPLAALTYMALYVAVVALSLPGASAMTLAGGLLFGLAAGASMTVVAATLGAVCIFLAARHGLGDALRARLAARGAQGLLARIDRGVQANAASYLLLMRLAPAVPFFVANLAPAFLGVRLRIFALTTFFGIIPGTVVYTWIGAGLGAVFARGEAPDPGLLLDPVVLGPILGLCALAALPIVMRALRFRGDA